MEKRLETVFTSDSGPCASAVARHVVEQHVVEQHVVEQHVAEQHVVERHIRVGDFATAEQALAFSFCDPRGGELIPAQNARTVVLGIADAARCERIAEGMRRQGYSVVTASTGSGVVYELADALLGEGEAVAPVLIIVEDLLPGVLGRTIIDGVRDMGWTTPVILVGGRCRIGDAMTQSFSDDWGDEELVASAQSLAFSNLTVLANATKGVCRAH